MLPAKVWKSLTVSIIKGIGWHSSNIAITWFQE
jgi:hypothetical protein